MNFKKMQMVRGNKKVKPGHESGIQERDRNTEEKST